MGTRRADELLYDSEASLRLVDDALDGLRDPGLPADRRVAAALRAAILRARSRILGELASLGAGGPEPAGPDHPDGVDRALAGLERDLHRVLAARSRTP